MQERFAARCARLFTLSTALIAVIGFAAGCGEDGPTPVAPENPEGPEEPEVPSGPAATIKLGEPAASGSVVAYVSASDSLPADGHGVMVAPDTLPFSVFALNSEGEALLIGTAFAYEDVVLDATSTGHVLVRLASSPELRNSVYGSEIRSAAAADADFGALVADIASAAAAGSSLTADPRIAERAVAIAQRVASALRPASQLVSSNQSRSNDASPASRGAAFRLEGLSTPMKI